MNRIVRWQEQMGLNDREAMGALGIGSRHTWAKYRDEGAPRLVELAAWGLMHELLGPIACRACFPGLIPAKRMVYVKSS